MRKRIAILGSTGSIGTTALRVIDGVNASLTEEEQFKVVALSGHSNVKLLAEQVRRYQPRYAAVSDTDYVSRFQRLVEGQNVQVLAGTEGLKKIAEVEEVDTVLAAVVGAAGLAAVLAAIRKGKRAAIANKEPLVIAGKLITSEAKKCEAQLIPVDSEHSAIFQALQSGRHNEVEKIVLTTSGGPFRGARPENIHDATVEQVLAHPVWRMGRKITVDSATMMNKALEIIEARWLFNMTPEKIEVLVHPQSIIHSLVEFVDGSVIAQMGIPDMSLPIQYALTYPVRMAGIAKKLKAEHLRTLTFEQPDFRVFPAIEMGFEVAQKGGTAAAVFNAANEAAVEQFLAGRIKFGNIVELVRHCLENCNYRDRATLEELLEADAWAKKEVMECLKNHQLR
ncbi:MAG: 1-deoxy-D-xylulose-5-phosphate reductoisomerase [Sedimentisphaerales bacterium]|nr:1-deoxy-D-xylulose-5-phosphate reductoisomerase [Sedimentisphaerales bacterium]